MTLYQVRQAINKETDESKLTELIILRGRLLSEEKKTEELDFDMYYERILDAYHK